MNWYLDVLKKYAVFNGRARRKEYWMFFLFNVMISIAVAILAVAAGATVLVNIYALAVLIPGIAVAVRRIHDTGRSGWWVLVPIAGLVFLFLDGERTDNKYGPNPKAAEGGIAFKAA